MAKKTDPARACLHVRDWPAPDQALWAEATSRDNFDNEALVRRAWRPSTTQANREGYGRWMNHLKRSGAELNIPPDQRVTPEQVKLYLQELRAQELGLQTIANRISQLLSVMLVFAPEQEWNWLRQRFNRYALMAKDAREPRPLTKLSGDVLVPALKQMDAIRKTGGQADPPRAIEYRNWLMLAMLMLTSLRRENLARIEIGVHLKLLNGEWLVDLPPAQVKQKKRIKMPVPGVLEPFLDFYLKEVRPILLHGRETARLCISQRGTAMGAHSIYIAVANFTAKQLGERINPHRFRHIGATSTAIAAPEKHEEARALLTHSDVRTTEERYIIAKSLAASRQHADVIADLRRRLPS
jgi:site-specific recombinase XerD